MTQNWEERFDERYIDFPVHSFGGRTLLFHKHGSFAAGTSDIKDFIRQERITLLGGLINECHDRKRNLKGDEAYGSCQGIYNAGLQDAISIVERQLNEK